LSYSPLALGFLTGKYNKNLFPSGPRANIAEDLFKDESFEELLSTMNGIANKHDASISQVALNWARGKGTIPIPGARNLKQVKQNLSCLDWSLNADEMKSLDEASSRVRNFVTPDKNPFPREDRNTGLKMYDS
jgi:pyridoxine 4-dehydrogenase